MRTVPAGFSRSSLKEESCCPMLSSAGRNVPSSRSPASVSVTRRVVRVKKAHAELGFQPPDGVARRRLGRAEFGCGAGSSVFFRDREEGVEIDQILAPLVPGMRHD